MVECFIYTQIKLSNAKVMFDFIADVVLQFLDESGIVGGRKGQQPLKLGFTFSYPVDQTKLDVGTLMQYKEKELGKDDCLSNILVLVGTRDSM
jgi:hexokinase